MFGFWYWLPVVFTMLTMLMILCIPIGFILFVALYGEKIRQIILNLPGYTPNWFTFVDFSKPTRPWDIVGVFFFVYRIMGAIFAKKTSMVNETFKSRLPIHVIPYLKFLRYMSAICIIFLVATWGIFYLQDHGFLNG